MPFVLEDRVRESATTTGTGPITLAGAAGGYQRFGAVLAIGDTTWYSIVLPGSAWETGIGTYSALNTLTRTTVLRSSNANAAVLFAAGTKDVFICPLASKANALNNSFPPGTLMLFQQTTAPIYWTKQVTHDDKALRVVSGTASSGGTNDFSTVMAQTVVGNHTITGAESASHSHSSGLFFTQAGPGGVGGGGAFGTNLTASTSSFGSDGAHNHTIALSIKYVDLIICSKD